jgi:omega-amidase
MRIYACQLDIAWEDKAANYGKVESLLATTPPAPDSLIVLPEMFSTGFSMNLEATREGIPSDTEAFLSALSIQHQSWVMAGLISPAAGGESHNDSVTFDPAGRLVARYAKVQPFNFGGEGDRHRAGDAVHLFDCNGFRVCPFVCYDLRFPELFRIGASRGAELYVVIANWPAIRTEHWMALLKARAIENQAYVVGVNRCGTQPGLPQAGCSQVIDPHGKIIADAGELECVMEAEIERQTLLDWRAGFPALKDLRPEFLGNAE